MVPYKQRYASWLKAVKDLESKGVKYIGWANNGAEATKVEGDRIITIPHDSFRCDTSVLYYPLANEVLCVDMS